MKIPPDTLPEILDRIEKVLIEKAMTHVRGKQQAAARLLGIKPSALYYKLAKYGLDK